MSKPPSEPILVAEESPRVLAAQEVRLVSALVLLLGVGLFFALPFVLSIGAVVFLPFVAGLFLSILLAPLAGRFTRWGVPGMLSALLALVVFLLFVMLVLALGLYPMLRSRVTLSRGEGAVLLLVIGVILLIHGTGQLEYHPSAAELEAAAQ